MKKYLLAGLMTTGLYADDPVRPAEITPLAGPVVKNWAEFFVTADFIYWQARQDDMAFASDGNFNFTGIPATNNPKKGNQYNLDYNFEPGFKVGLGVDFRHDGWDLYANYTWLQQNDAKGDASFDVTKGQLFSLWQLAANGGAIVAIT